MNKVDHDAAVTEGRKAFDEEDWVGAIRSFLEAIKSDDTRIDTYIALIGAYEAAAEEYGDPELLDQASRVCRDARAMHLDAKQRAMVDAMSDRIAERLAEEARHDPYASHDDEEDEEERL